MNHQILADQVEDAKRVLAVAQFITLSDDAWSNVDPYSPTIADDLLHYKKILHEEAKEDDYLLVQGDFGATYHMIRYAQMHKLIPIYATTKRSTKEEIINGKVMITREFQHIRFRKYEEL